MKADLLRLVASALVLSGSLSEPIQAAPTRVDIVLEIDANEVQSPFGPADRKILNQNFYNGILLRLKPSLTFWQLKPASDGDSVEAIPNYSLVFHIFQGVYGRISPELKLDLYLRKGTAAEVINKWPPIPWRPPNDEDGFGTPRDLARELVLYFSKLLDGAGFARTFQKHVPIGTGAFWLSRGTLGLELPQEPYSALVNSAFTIHGRRERRSCQLQCNGAGGFVRCRKPLDCLEVEPMCCVLGNRRYSPDQVAGLKEFELNEFFLAGNPETGWDVFEPEECN